MAAIGEDGQPGLDAEHPSLLLVIEVLKDEDAAMTQDDDEGEDETGKGGDDYELEDGSIDYDRMEADHGRAYVEVEVGDSGDPDGIDYLNATDTSCTNEELGLDEEGNREDD